MGLKTQLLTNRSGICSISRGQGASEKPRNTLEVMEKNFFLEI